MDERYWWIVSRVQHSFNVRATEEAHIFAENLRKRIDLSPIESFLCRDGSRRLFIYFSSYSKAVGTEDISVTNEPSDIAEATKGSFYKILYFLRLDNSSDVSQTSYENEIYCGEINSSILENLNDFLNDIVLPCTKARQNWGLCTGEQKSQILSSLEKFTSAITEASSTSSKTSYQKILEVPPDAAATDFKATRQAAHDPEMVQRFEEIVSGWMTTIETTVLTPVDARSQDAILGPLAELDKWRRRNRILAALTEQLKGKECKNIIGVLITAKSRLLKKWKAVDIAITDAVNDARDKLKYLDSLRRYLEDLYSPGLTPGYLVNQTLPGMLTTMKQMDSASRYYSRSGFLGLLFNQIGNQLVLCFKDYLRNLAVGGEKDQDQLWTVAFKEARAAKPEDFVDGSDRLIRTHFEQKLSQGRLHHAKSSADQLDFDANSATLIGRIRACLMVQRLMRVALRHLRDGIGLSHGAASASQGSQGTNQRAASAGGAAAAIAGISMHDDDAILRHLDAFSGRLRQFLDVQASLSQMFRLARTAQRLPRPRKEDLELDDVEAASAEMAAAKAAAAVAVGSGLGAVAPTGVQQLEAIEEDNEQQSAADAEEGKSSAQRQRQRSGVRANAGSAATTPAHGNDEELLRSIALMRKYYDSEGEGPAFSGVVKSFTERVTCRLQDRITTSSFLDVESKDKEKFTDVYRGFVDTLSELEQFSAAYVHTIFQWKFYPQEALDILQALSPIGHRPVVKAALADKYVEIFGQFEEHLNDIRRLYEEGKTAPPRVRNSPPVAGAINWSRQLLKQIEEPMKVFRDNPDVSSQLDYPRIVKMYNKVATALTAFEQLYLGQWRAQVEVAKASLNATLFVRHPVTRELVVNLDEKVLELLQETKWLMRLGVKVPEGALGAMQLAPRIKRFAQCLREVLAQHRAVLARIPVNLAELCRGHLDRCFEAFQAGLNNLAWNSTNIDGYLHLLETAVRRLNDVITEVNGLLEAKVEGQLREIGSALLFDEAGMFGQSWAPESFRTAFTDSVRRCALETQERVNIIAQGLQEIAQKLALKQPASQSIQHQAQQQQQKRPSSAELVKSLTDHYVSELYQAVLSAVTRTLVTVAESTGVEDSGVLSSLSGLVRSRPQSRASRPASTAASPDSASESDHRDRPATVTSEAAADVLTIDDYRRAKAQASAALTAVAKFSHPVWCDTDKVTYLRFAVALCYSVPKLVIQPELDEVQRALTTGVEQIFGAVRGLAWPGTQGVGAAFCSQLLADGAISELSGRIGSVTQDLWSRIRELIVELGVYDFLWKDNLPTNLADFLDSQPSNAMLCLEVDRLMAVEDRVSGLKPEYTFGCVQLQTQKAVDVLQGFVLTWKEAFASELHARVKQDLEEAAGYRRRQESELRQLERQLNPERPSGSGGGGSSMENIRSKVTLDDLNVALKLLEELRDMENKVDKIYLPIETMYAKLQSYKLSLPRSEIEECHGLRDNWLRLMQLADQVRMQLLKDHRSHFEQELDKQVKNFVVEVIQFRNQFDAQGPFVPDIEPMDAVKRLQRFQEVYNLHSRKRQTLDSVSHLFGVVVRQFDELDRTGEELVLLNLLYDLFQKFIRFDEAFRQELWEDVDLDRTAAEVEGYWDESLALPSKLRGWAAHLDMKARMQRYRMLLPLLKKLKSKEIRSRHWTQVMQITGVNFSLEKETFRLNNLLDIGLLEHAEAVEEVCLAAQKEQELELKMKQIEEEWTEQVLSFLRYKRKGFVLLDKAVTERLLEQLEHSQTELAVMLTSRHVEPLREEAASWAEKLKDIFHVLELWAEVQELWQDLEAVFCVPETARELPQEAKRFEGVDRSYVKSMKRAYATKNVLQCCIGGGDVPKSVVLRHMREELEICFKSLVAYLDGKRRVFPRLSFVSNSILLSILRRPHDLETVRPQLSSLFTAVSDVHTETVAAPPDSGHRAPQADQLSASSVARGGRRTPAAKAGGNGSGGGVTLVEPLGQHQEKEEESQQQITEDAAAEKVIHDICAVMSPDGDELILDKKVRLDSNVEVWLSELQRNIADTLTHLSRNVISDINACGPLDELAFRYPSQVCRLGLIYYWTKECEFAIGDIRNDRKALQNVTKKFSATMTRLPTILHRGAWKTIEDPMLPVHKRRLNNMITEAYYLRECLETMITRKVKDPGDFDWRRCVKCYAREASDEQPTPWLHIYDTDFPMGPEFMGSAPVLAPTPMTDRCFLAMSQALRNLSGCLVQGPTGCGKTETVKGLAQLLCRHICVTHARSSFDSQALSKLVQGVVADGCWSLIDEVQKLPAEATGVLVDHVRSVFHSLASGLKTCHLGEAHEVSIGPSVSFLITYNPFNQAGELSSEIRAYYRPVSITRPDLLQVLKMKCLAMGFRAPTLLATRLKLMSEYAADQLPSEPENVFGLNSLCAVLARADELRKLAADEAAAMATSRQASSMTNAGTSQQQHQQGQQQGQQQQQQQQQQQLATSEFWPPYKERTEIITNKATGQKLPTFVNKKAGANAPLSAAAKQEHSMARQAALELLEPRVRPQSVAILRQAVGDVFSGLPPAPSSAVARKTADILERIGRVCQSKRLTPSKAWLEKCIQIFNVSAAHKGVFLAGPSGCGKTSALEVLVAALAALGGGAAEDTHRLQRIYPLAVDSLGVVFGEQRANGEWRDGVFTSAFRKANRNQSTTWMHLDAPLNTSWSDNFNSVLDAEATLHLRNGDQLRISDRVRVVFETDRLADASPAALGRAGIVHFDEASLGWRPLAAAWLRTRSPQVAHTLNSAFEKTLDALIPWLQTEVKPIIANCLAVGVFQSCLSLLEAMLNESAGHLSGNVHIERLYLFALVWSFGALLVDGDRVLFSKKLKDLSSA